MTVGQSNEAAVTAWLDEQAEDLIAWLGTLVRHQSVGPDEASIQRELEEFYRQRGFEVAMWEPEEAEISENSGYIKSELGYRGRENLVATLRGADPGPRDLVFNSHVDVIPVDLAAWDTDPWEPVIRGDRLYARGASDMKGGVAAANFALAAIKACGIQLQGTVHHQCVVDEENTANGTLSAIRRGFVADAAISTEPSDLEVHPAFTGSHWFTIEVRGKSASMLRRWEGVSAIEKASLFIDAVSAFESERIATLRHPLYPDNRGALACVVGQIKGGSFPSSVPGWCEIKGRIGTLPGEDVAATKSSFKQFVLDAASQDEWLKDHPPSIEFSGMDAAPAEISPDAPICDTLRAVHEAVVGSPAVVVGHDGGADTRVMIPAGIATATYGPGPIAQMHADNEWTSVSEVLSAAKVYALAAMRWCGTLD
jgi:acetylornithine deacetylase